MAFSFPKNVTFPDAEKIICTYLKDQFSEVTPKVHVGTWIPDSSGEILDSGEAILFANRVGGHADYNDRASVDTSIVCLSIVGKTRRDALDVAMYARQCLYDISSGGFIGDWRISRIQENEGPSELAYSDPTTRLVRLYFQVGIVRHTR